MTKPYKRFQKWVTEFDFLCMCGCYHETKQKEYNKKVKDWMIAHNLDPKKYKRLYVTYIYLTLK